MKITPLTDELIYNVIKIAKKAGTAIMDVYVSDFDIQIKDDRSPLTEADMRANAIIIEGLNRLPRMRLFYQKKEEIFPLWKGQNGRHIG